MMNLDYPSEWLGKAELAFAEFGRKARALFFLLLTVNSIALPYAGVTHDARLYSIQVVNQVEGGAYADDLFFRYGSQDEYSLFSRLASPVVRWLGLPTAFFVIYLLSKSILIFGMTRLAQTLVPHRTATTLALIYCMAIGLHYGGQQILRLQENFVTPRTLGCGLVLIGLDLLLRGTPVSSLLLMLLAAAIHPLMACGGAADLDRIQPVDVPAGREGLHQAQRLPGCTLAAVVLGIEPLGKRCFGENGRRLAGHHHARQRVQFSVRVEQGRLEFPGDHSLATLGGGDLEISFA